MLTGNKEDGKVVTLKASSVTLPGFSHGSGHIEEIIDKKIPYFSQFHWLSWRSKENFQPILRIVLAWLALVVGSDEMNSTTSCGSLSLDFQVIVQLQERGGVHKPSVHQISVLAVQRSASSRSNSSMRSSSVDVNLAVSSFLTTRYTIEVTIYTKRRRGLVLNVEHNSKCKKEELSEKRFPFFGPFAGVR